METKKWYASKAIWAGIVTALVGAAQSICLLFGFDLLAQPIAGIIITILGALGIYGRTTANTTIVK
jgi:uncharacterized membrane protein